MKLSASDMSRVSLSIDMIRLRFNISLNKQEKMRMPGSINDFSTVSHCNAISWPSIRLEPKSDYKYARLQTPRHAGFCAVYPSIIS